MLIPLAFFKFSSVRLFSRILLLQGYHRAQRETGCLVQGYSYECPSHILALKA